MERNLRGLGVFRRWGEYFDSGKLKGQPSDSKSGSELEFVDSTSTSTNWKFKELESSNWNWIWAGRSQSRIPGIRGRPSTTMNWLIVVTDDRRELEQVLELKIFIANINARVAIPAVVMWLYENILNWSLLLAIWDLVCRWRSRTCRWDLARACPMTKISDLNITW